MEHQEHLYTWNERYDAYCFFGKLYSHDELLTMIENNEIKREDFFKPKLLIPCGNVDLFEIKDYLIHKLHFLQNKEYWGITIDDGTYNDLEIHGCPPLICKVKRIKINGEWGNPWKIILQWIE